MTTWREVRLDEVADVTVGHVGSMATEYLPSGVPFLRSQNIQPLRLDLDGVKFISEAFHRRLRKSVLRSGDVAIVRTGKPGAAVSIPAGLPEMNCSDLVIARPRTDVDSRWLAYFINAVAGHFVSSRLVGAVQQHFNVGAAREMLLRLPPLAEQKAMADVLAALDDKIESNRRRAGTAEAVLDVLASAYGGLDPAPLGDLVDVDRIACTPQSHGDVLVDHFSLPAFDAGRLPDRAAGNTIKSGKLLVTEESVLVSRLNPSTNRTWFAVPDSLTMAAASTEFLVLRPGVGLGIGGLWLAVRDEFFRAELARRATGTSGSHQRVRPDDALTIDVPDVRGLQPAVAAEADGLLRLVRHSRNESRTIAELRDALLPELLSGRLRVPVAEELVEAAT